MDYLKSSTVSKAANSQRAEGIVKFNMAKAPYSMTVTRAEINGLEATGNLWSHTIAFE